MVMLITANESVTRGPAALKENVMIKNVFAKLALIAFGTCAVAASAATNSATFQVLLKIQNACTVTAGAASNIDLGTQNSSATNLTGNSNISVTCSKKTPYFIGLAPSNSNTSGAGVMAALNVAPVTGNTDTVPYQLRSTAGIGGTIWGNTATAAVIGNGVSGTGNGVAQSIPVYATAASANFTPDSYADTVTVNVNY